MQERLKRNRFISEFYQVEINFRLVEIERAYRDLSSDQAELMRYIPIALYATVESFFRLAIKALIDHGEPFLSNAEKVLDGNRKFDFDTLKTLSGRSVTIGDLIAAQVRLSSIESLLKAITELLGQDFKETLESTTDRWEDEVKGNPDTRIIDNIDTTINCVKETFRLRHVFCHETAGNETLTKETVDNCIKHTKQFLDASGEVIGNVRFPDHPLTQADMTKAAADKYSQENALLARLTGQVKQVLSDDEQFALFEKAQTAWESFMDSTTNLEGTTSEGGSIQPMIKYMAAVRLIEERKQNLRYLLTLFSDY